MFDLILTCDLNKKIFSIICLKILYLCRKCEFAKFYHNFFLIFTEMSKYIIFLYRIDVVNEQNQYQN